MASNLIMIFIGVANIVAILLVYYSFGKEMEKQKKIINTMVTIGVIYIIALITYNLSSIGLEKNVVSNTAKMALLMVMVPVDTILFAPILIRSYMKKKSGEIELDKLNKIAITIGIIALIIMIFEFFYFRNFQKDIIDMKNKIQSNNVTSNEIVNEVKNNEQINSINNVISNNNNTLINNIK